MPLDSPTTAHPDLDVLVSEMRSGNTLSSTHLKQLDSVLTWIGGMQNQPPHPALKRYANKNGINLDTALGTLFSAFDRWFENRSLNHPDWNLFGMENQPDVNERRYRLLLRLYHPDRGLISNSLASARTNAVVKSFKKYKQDRSQEEKTLPGYGPASRQPRVDERHLINLKLHHILRLKLRSWLPASDNLGIYITLGLSGVLIAILILLQVS